MRILTLIKMISIDSSIVSDNT